MGKWAGRPRFQGIPTCAPELQAGELWAPHPCPGPTVTLGWHQGKLRPHPSCTLVTCVRVPAWALSGSLLALVPGGRGWGHISLRPLILAAASVASGTKMLRDPSSRALAASHTGLGPRAACTGWPVPPQPPTWSGLGPVSCCRGDKVACNCAAFAFLGHLPSSQGLPGSQHGAGWWDLVAQWPPWAVAPQAGPR